MSGLRRLRRIFTDGATKPSIKPKAKPKPKYDYSTPNALRKTVDDFKKSCDNKDFRRRINVYNSIVHRLTQAQALPMIEEIIESQKQYDEISDEGFVIRLISLYGKAGMVDHARGLFDQIPSFNCPRTVKSLSALLNAYITAKRYDAVLELFRQLPSQYSIELDVMSYNIIIHALCQMGSTDSALSLLHEMEELGLKPNVVTFNTLLGPFYEKRGFVEGEKIWALMQAQDGICPDVATYKSRMNGMIMDGRVTEAVKLVDEMRVNGVEPDVRIFNVLIKCFCEDGKLEEAKYWYDELVRSGCIADRTTYTTLVPFLLDKGDFDMALKLCKDAMSGGRRLLISVEMLKRVVEGFVAEGMNGKAEEIVDFAKKMNFEIDLPNKLEVEPAQVL